MKLQTIKATGDVEAGEKLFDKYSRLDEPWNRWRDIVLMHKQPRNIFVQPNTVIGEGRLSSLNTYSLYYFYIKVLVNIVLLSCQSVIRSKATPRC